MGIPVFREKKVKHLFITLLLSFFASLLLFLIILAVTFFFGYKRSVAGWGEVRRGLIENQVYKELKDILPQDIAGKTALLEKKLSPLIPHNMFFAVYNQDKKVIYTHSRQHGMRRARMLIAKNEHKNVSNLPLKSVKENGKITGYYRIGPVGFGIDRANTQFLESMRKTTLLSIAFASVLALLTAFILSKRFARTAQTVSSGIDRIAHGELSVRIPEKGVQEISLIARSANKLGKKLEREEALRRQWASDVAHDLRTPITALKSQLEGMADGVLDLTKERIIRNIKELSRIESLVDNLGELIRLESPEMRISTVKIDTGSFFNELKNRFAQLFEKGYISVRWERGAESFTGDENLLLRAVSNFISNAIRHTTKNGEIRISLRREGAEVCFSVFNTGKGIPTKEIDKVFDRLYRGEYARKSPGSGLGLTISQKIAELHGGNVTIYSAENYGTTVQMRIKG